MATFLWVIDRLFDLGWGSFSQEDDFSDKKMTDFGWFLDVIEKWSNPQSFVRWESCEFHLLLHQGSRNVKNTKDCYDVYLRTLFSLSELYRMWERMKITCKSSYNFYHGGSSCSLSRYQQCLKSGIRFGRRFGLRLTSILAR